MSDREKEGNDGAGEGFRVGIGEAEAEESAEEWERAMHTLRAENSELNLHTIIMNPLVPYAWCDYYLGDEVGRWIQRDPSRWAIFGYVSKLCTCVRVFACGGGRWALGVFVSV